MQRDTRVLLIDGDATFLSSAKRLLSECGFDVAIASTAEEGIDGFRRTPFGVVLAELKLPDVGAFEVLRRLLEIDATAEVIVLADDASVRLAVDAVKAGAFYVVQKPVEPDRLRDVVERAIEKRALGGDAHCFAESYREIIGHSKLMQDVFATIDAVAKSDANVLIVGESGTGKELIADAIHRHSLRARNPFVKINCAAIPGDLVENELFGHVRGAFTGATHEKEGLIGAASGGSLLLDEIGEMPVELQPKVLRVLQERQYTRVGSATLRKADFRLISSTNQVPIDAIRNGRLREDLYYRISTITIRVPALRERPEDIGPLAEHMLARFTKKYDKAIAGFSSGAYAAIIDYSWPGNVRELESAIERAVLLSHGPTVEADVLSHHARSQASHVAAVVPVRPPDAASEGLVIASHDLGQPTGRENARSRLPGRTLAEIERKAILQALRRVEGNITAAADSLGIGLSLLYAKIEHYNLMELIPGKRSSPGSRRAPVE